MVLYNCWGLIAPGQKTELILLSLTYNPPTDSLSSAQLLNHLLMLYLISCAISGKSLCTLSYHKQREKEQCAIFIRTHFIRGLLLGLGLSWGVSVRPDLHLAYTHRRKVENNRTKYSRPEIFWQCNQGIEPKLQ